MAESHQYLVYPPRLSITACIRLGIFSTSLWMLHWPILRHSSCSAVASSSRFDVWTSRLLTARSRASHACSIGLQSGEYAGHGNWSICCCCRKYCTTRARCGGALSCWSRTFLLKRCLAYGISSVCNGCRYICRRWQNFVAQPSQFFRHDEFCPKHEQNLHLPWQYQQHSPLGTIHLAVASHGLFRQSDEAKTRGVFYCSSVVSQKRSISVFLHSEDLRSLFYLFLLNR